MNASLLRIIAFDRTLRDFVKIGKLYAKTHAILKTAQKQGLYLGDWYTSVIAPADTDLSAMHYTPGSCPRAEKLSKEVLNLPTHIRTTQGDVERIVDFLNSSLREA